MNITRIIIHTGISILGIIGGTALFRRLKQRYSSNQIVMILLLILIVGLAVNELTGLSGSYRLWLRIFIVSFTLGALVNFRAK